MAASAFTAGLEAEPAMRHSVLSMKSGMALQAQLPALAPRQQHAIGAAVRSVAGGTAFYLQRRMLVDKRATLFGVAAHASLVIRFLQAGVIERSVRIVAVGALHQAFGHAMMHGQGKLRLHRAVTTEAQLRL